MQVKSGTYDPDANLALLRHYQFAPEKTNINCIATMLIKAQMQLPNHDFTQLLQLIPERVQVTLLARAFIMCVYPLVIMFPNTVHANAIQNALQTHPVMGNAAALLLRHTGAVAHSRAHAGKDISRLERAVIACERNSCILIMDLHLFVVQTVPTCL